MEYIIWGIIIFSILYVVICGAVKEGTLKAMIEFEKIKNNY